jgi:hypothetical protein
MSQRAGRECKPSPLTPSDRQADPRYFVQAPEALVIFVQSLQTLALPREPAKDSIPTSLANLQAQRRHHQDLKQRPKKIHEVARMSIEAGKLVLPRNIRTAVDVGAGQVSLSSRHVERRFRRWLI